MKKLSIGQIALLAALIIILILTGVWAVSVWNASGDAVMDKHAGSRLVSAPSSRSSSDVV
jgi:hypothetical protein